MPDQQHKLYHWKELLLLSQNGDTGATLKLVEAFRFLLYYEAAKIGDFSSRASVLPGYRKRKTRSEMILLFLRFITDFRDFSLPDAKLPLCFRNYLKAVRQENPAAKNFSAPPFCAVDYATEIEKTGTRFRQFPQDMLRIKQTAFVFHRRSKPSYRLPRHLLHKKTSFRCFFLREQNKQKRAYKITSIIFILR